MSNALRKSFERKLDEFIPPQNDEFQRRKLIKEYPLVFSDEDILDILSRRKPLYYEKGEGVHLPK